MRVLKTALIALVTTCVVLPLPLVIVGAVSGWRRHELIVYTDAPILVIAFFLLFGVFFFLAWFLVGRGSVRPVS